MAVIEYDKSRGVSEEQRLKSLADSVRRAFDELENESKSASTSEKETKSEPTLKFLGEDPISSPEEDTPANWIALGTGYAYISPEILQNYPSSTACILKNIVVEKDGAKYVFQTIYLLNEQSPTWKRSGNEGSWYGESEIWVKMLDENSKSTIRLYRTTEYTGMGTTYNYFEPFYGANELGVDAQSGNLSLLKKVITEYGDRQNQSISGVLVGEGINCVEVNAAMYVENTSNVDSAVGLIICRERDGVITRLAYTRQLIQTSTPESIVANTIVPVEEGDFIFLMGWRINATRIYNVLYIYGSTQMTVKAVR